MQTNKDYVCYAPMVMWCYNYDYNFIEVVWKDEPLLVDHLETKWKGYVNDCATTSDAMLKFYANLDGENQRLLDAYIYNKYKHMHNWVGEFYSETTPTE